MAEFGLSRTCNFAHCFFIAAVLLSRYDRHHFFFDLEKREKSFFFHITGILASDPSVNSNNYGHRQSSKAVINMMKFFKKGTNSRWIRHVFSPALQRQDGIAYK